MDAHRLVINQSALNLLVLHCYHSLPSPVIAFLFIAVYVIVTWLITSALFPVFYVPTASPYAAQHYTPAVVPSTHALAAGQIQPASLVSQSPTAPQKEGWFLSWEMF